MSDKPCDICGEHATHLCGGETPANYCNEHMPGWSELAEAFAAMDFGPPTTYVLYGVTDRDPDNELVCQFFGSVEDREDFAAFLPGRYDRMTLHGINYDEFEVEVEGFDGDQPNIPND